MTRHGSLNISVRAYVIEQRLRQHVQNAVDHNLRESVALKVRNIQNLLKHLNYRSLHLKRDYIYNMSHYAQSVNPQDKTTPELLPNGTYEVEWEIPYENTDGSASPFLYLPGKLTISDRGQIQGETHISISEMPKLEYLPGVVSTEHYGLLFYSKAIPLIRGLLKKTNREILVPDAEVRCIASTISIKANNGFISLSPIFNWKEITYAHTVPQISDFSLSLGDVKYITERKTISSSETFSMDAEYPINDLMEYCISPAQIICSSLLGTLKCVNYATATLALQPKKHNETFQVVGEAIRNVSASDDEHGESHSRAISTNVLRSLLSKWQSSIEKPIIRTYGVFCLEQSGLTRFKFLLCVEALESEYDSLYKSELETKEQEEQEKIKQTLNKLGKLFMKDDTHILNSKDRKAIRQAVKNNQQYMPLARKLKTLCNTKPWIKIRLEENSTLKNIIKENKQKGWGTFDSLAAIRNWLSHGDKEDLGDGFPDLVNVMESWCRAILFEALGTSEEVVQKVSDFYGWNQQNTNDNSHRHKGLWTFSWR